ncbi:MAG: hypothetical protein EOO06_06000 [Chitinophagaceae bacterium]|nr:MAG: hypothetical protein EOO06_06000 [Chitinophagaceae bacterium]
MVPERISFLLKPVAAVRPCLPLLMRGFIKSDRYYDWLADINRLEELISARRRNLFCQEGNNLPGEQTFFINAHENP